LICSDRKRWLVLLKLTLDWGFWKTITIKIVKSDKNVIKVHNILIY
jgi:hypothetical protein